MPGAGKGTQGKLLHELFGIPHISTGDIFREAMRDCTETGKVAKMYVDKGELVPDEVVTDMVRERLGKGDCQKGFILDGYPRTVTQASSLDDMCGEWDRKITAVLQFTLSGEEAIKRLTARRSCRSCGTVYNLINRPPAREAICDLCKGELYQRDDDTKEVIENRLRVYEKQTAPLLTYYDGQKNLYKIDASLPIKEIKDNLYELLRDKATL